MISKEKHCCAIRRVAKIWKRGGGGGFFERVRKVQTTLTGIFIDLESVSHGLSENWDEISRKAQKFKIFSAQNQVVSKKKKVFTGIETDFSAKFGNLNVWEGALFLWGAIFNFSPKIGLKSTKNVRFCILHKPMGGLEPPPPPRPP